MQMASHKMSPTPSLSSNFDAPVNMVNASPVLRLLCHLDALDGHPSSHRTMPHTILLLLKHSEHIVNLCHLGQMFAPESAGLKFDRCMIHRQWSCAKKKVSKRNMHRNEWHPPHEPCQKFTNATSPTNLNSLLKWTCTALSSACPANNFKLKMNEENMQIF